MRSYTVVGVGAVGGLYGARLAAAGHSVRWVARSDADHLRRHGLVVESPFGDVRLGPLDVTPGGGHAPPTDVVVVAVKTTANASLAELLPPLLGPDTIVVLLQNGLGVEEAVRSITGPRPLLGGLCFVCSNRVGPGHIQHLDYGRVVLGQDAAGGRPAGLTPALEAVVGDLARAGVPAAWDGDLVSARWHKLVWNVPFNGLSVVLNALPQELLAEESGRVLVHELMGEVQSGAAACGRTITDDFLAQMHDDTVAMRPYLTSMKLDYEAGRPLELEAIVGAPARAAVAAGVRLPGIEMLYRQLRFLDGRRRAAMRVGVSGPGSS